MAHQCDKYRIGALERLTGATVGDPARGSGCDACDAWEQRQSRLVGELGVLTRLTAPAELLERCATEFALRNLERRAAPGALDTRVQRAVAEIGRETPAERLLRGLESVVAPHVLDRLVAEELSDPERARARRFAGDLPRLQAPDGLVGSLRDSLARPTQRRLRVLGSAIASLAAAALVFVSLQPERTPVRREYRFEVIEVSSVSELSPFARALVDAASGGLAGSVPSGDSGVLGAPERPHRAEQER